jgi:protein-S-isoprenylcysteine O-methyltransferase Ste14
LSWVLATLGTGTVALLLRRMRRELESTGQLSAPSTACMYGCYTAHATATAAAARERLGTLRIPAAPAAAVGGVLSAGGAGLCVAGMRRFAGFAQISGTDIGGLATGGIYRYTRNPQYAGYIGLLAGVGLARRSAAVLALASAAAVVFRWWVGVEERHLDHQFGDAYRHYRETVPRWLPVGRAPRRPSAFRRT